ncbi:hypothetical protein D6789_02070, partial [Candidatus Woesearchaeota archaeon]
MKKLLIAVLFAMMLALSAWSVSAGIGAANHDPVVTLNRDVANCDESLDDYEYVVSVSNNMDNGYGIYNVKIYKGSAGIYQVSCGDAPAGWTCFDGDSDGTCDLKYNLYCEYETTPAGPNVIRYGDAPVDFSFDISLVDEAAVAADCGTDFRITTLDDEGIASPGEGVEVETMERLNVDCADPYIEKKLIGEAIPLTSCALESQNSIDGTCDWWITQATEIDFSAQDTTKADQCNLGVDYCEWRYYWDGELVEDNPYCEGTQEADGWCRLTNGGSLDWALQFGEDSEHDIEVRCVDKAGNWASLTEKDKVDNTPPTTEKWFNGPQKLVPTENGTVEYIDGVSTVEMSAQDGGDICAIGVDKTWYNIE